jgi:putative FmdB family regulatory protein
VGETLYNNGVSFGEVIGMPLYEYQCQECGLRFERRQGFSDDPVKICPDCDGPVVRLIQPAGIIFKGSGFYVTDNRSKSSTAIPGSRHDSNESESTSESKSASESSSADKPSDSSSNSKTSTKEKA